MKPKGSIYRSGRHIRGVRERERNVLLVSQILTTLKIFGNFRFGSHLNSAIYRSLEALRPLKFAQGALKDLIYESISF